MTAVQVAAAVATATATAMVTMSTVTVTTATARGQPWIGTMRSRCSRRMTAVARCPAAARPTARCSCPVRPPRLTRRWPLALCRWSPWQCWAAAQGPPRLPAPPLRPPAQRARCRRRRPCLPRSCRSCGQLWRAPRPTWSGPPRVRPPAPPYLPRAIAAAAASSTSLPRASGCRQEGQGSGLEARACGEGHQGWAPSHRTRDALAACQACWAAGVGEARLGPPAPLPAGPDGLVPARAGRAAAADRDAAAAAPEHGSSSAPAGTAGAAQPADGGAAAHRVGAHLGQQRPQRLQWPEQPMGCTAGRSAAAAAVGAGRVATLARRLVAALQLRPPPSPPACLLRPITHLHIASWLCPQMSGPCQPLAQEPWCTHTNCPTTTASTCECHPRGGHDRMATTSVRCFRLTINCCLK